MRNKSIKTLIVVLTMIVIFCACGVFATAGNFVVGEGSRPDITLSLNPHNNQNEKNVLTSAKQNDYVYLEVHFSGNPTTNKDVSVNGALLLVSYDKDKFTPVASGAWSDTLDSATYNENYATGLVYFTAANANGIGYKVPTNMSILGEGTLCYIMFQAKTAVDADDLNSFAIVESYNDGGQLVVTKLVSSNDEKFGINYSPNEQEDDPPAGPTFAITEQPSKGNSYTVTAGAVDGYSISYQWKDSAGNSLSGQTSSKLNVAGLSRGGYYCEVKWTKNTEVHTVSSAVVAVTDPTHTITVNAGSNNTITVKTVDGVSYSKDSAVKAGAKVVFSYSTTNKKLISVNVKVGNDKVKTFAEESDLAFYMPDANVSISMTTQKDFGKTKAVDGNQKDITVFTYYPAVKATCKTPGNLEYWYVKNANNNSAYFATGSLTDTTTKYDRSYFTIPAAHDYQNSIKWTLGDDGTPTLEFKRICSVCGEEESLSNLNVDIQKSGSASGGYQTWTATVSYNGSTQLTVSKSFVAPSATNAFTVTVDGNTYNTTNLKPGDSFTLSKSTAVDWYLGGVKVRANSKVCSFIYNADMTITTQTIEAGSEELPFVSIIVAERTVTGNTSKVKLQLTWSTSDEDVTINEVGFKRGYSDDAYNGKESFAINNKITPTDKVGFYTITINNNADRSAADLVAYAYITYTKGGTQYTIESSMVTVTKISA